MIKKNLLSNQEIVDIKNNYMYSKVYKNNYFEKLIKRKMRLVKNQFKLIKSQNQKINSTYTVEGKILDKILTKINILKLDIKKIEFENTKKINLQKSNTESVLYSLLINYNKNKNNKNLHKIIYIFIKKFEVSKKIYKSYNKNLKKKNSNTEDIKSQMLLALLLITSYLNKKQDLRYVNCLLKVSDKILYKFVKYFNQKEIFLILYFNYYLIYNLKKKYHA